MKWVIINSDNSTFNNYKSGTNEKGKIQTYFLTHSQDPPCRPPSLPSLPPQYQRLPQETPPRQMQKSRRPLSILLKFLFCRLHQTPTTQNLIPTPPPHPQPRPINEVQNRRLSHGSYQDHHEELETKLIQNPIQKQSHLH